MATQQQSVVAEVVGVAIEGVGGVAKGVRVCVGQVLGKQSANKSLIYAHIVAHKPNIYFLIHLCQCDLPNVVLAHCRREKGIERKRGRESGSE